MHEMILCKLGEVVLKGLNRRSFEDKLMSNVNRRVSKCGNFRVYSKQSTIYVEPKDDECDIEAAFYKRVHDLEREFEKQFDALFLEVRNTKNGMLPTFINVAISAQEDRQWRARAVGRGGQTATHSRIGRGRPEGGVAKIDIVITVSIRC